MIPDPRPCPHSCGWEQPDDTTWQRKVDAHLTLRHGAPPVVTPVPTVASVTALVAADPSHASEVEAVEYAYRRAATLNGGYVTANDARPLIPPWVTPAVVGAAVTRMKATGVLVDTDESEPSTDTKGRNTNKNAPRYFVPEWARAGIEGVRTG